MKRFRNGFRVAWLFTLRQKTILKYLAVPLELSLLVVPMAAAPARAPKITQVYTTAETSTSAEVIWNTSTASDSLLQYSTSNPVPTQAMQVYLANQVTVHEISLAALTPGTVYFYKVTSCSKRGCSSATGSFETFPDCPDVVPGVSGSWQKVISPNISAARNNRLLGVDAVSENDVWAVGWAQDPNGPPYVKRSFIQHFDGSTWSIVQSPNPRNDTNTQLHAVSAVSGNDVWAVGASDNGSLPGRSLIQHWDGTHWNIVTSPSPDTQFNELRGVAALTANNVWAVGYRGGSKSETPIETFVLHWDGVSWQQVASPNVNGGANQLFGITAISAGDIWAVGSVAGAPLALHWNGSTWNIVPVNVGSGLSTEKLTAVSGSASNDMWAVGDGKGIFTNQTFATILHWDGTRWTEKVCRAVSSSNPPAGYEGGGPDSYFTSIAAAGGNDVWAVGVLGSGPMILHWDGRAWTTITHPRVFPNAGLLYGVTTSSNGSAWTVGIEIVIDATGSTSSEHTLIDKYTP
jgi:hypothetical protein